MKNILFIIFCFFLTACKERPKNTKSENPITKISGPSEKYCFLSLMGNTEIQGKKIQDSLILQLNVAGKTVTGIYNWVPAEKDRRQGKISAKKEGDIIEGIYTFFQEGAEHTQPIRIEIQKNYAKVATNRGKPDQMKVRLEKVSCR